MQVFRTVARKVLTPKTRAHSSLESEDAIWELRQVVTTVRTQ